MKILTIALISLFATASFADNTTINSNDINTPSERETVLNQDLTSGEEVSAQILSKKYNALNKKIEQFKPVYNQEFTGEHKSMPSGTSLDSGTLLTIEKKFDSSITSLEFDANVFLRSFGGHVSGVACSIEILINGSTCSSPTRIYGSKYFGVSQAPIELYPFKGICSNLNAGTYNISMRMYRGNIYGSYNNGSCDFLYNGWGTQYLKVQEVYK